MLIGTKIKSAIESTAYYNHLYNQVDIKNINQFSIITKQDVVENVSKFYSTLPQSSKTITVSTSGSSGYPLQIVWNERDYLNSLIEIWRIRSKLGIQPSDKFVSSHILFNKDEKVFTNKIIIKNNNLSLSKLHYDEKTLLRYYKEILDFQPKWMLLPPGFLYGFLSFLSARNYKLPSSILLIELTGEYCTNEVYYYFKNQYPNIFWKLLYGMQEFNVIGYGDPSGLEILDNNVNVEVISNDGNSAEAFEEGAIIVTGLKNSAMPLIRYKTEDYGFFDSQGKLHITKARSNDNIIIDNQVFDGSLFWMIIFKLKYVLNVLILHFQIILENNILLFQMQIDPICKYDEQIIKNFINNILIYEFHLNYEVKLCIVDRILTNTIGNKIKFFINNQY